MKICKECAQAKPLDSYGPDKFSRDRLKYRCKECTSKLAREKRLNSEETRLRQVEAVIRYKKKMLESPESEAYVEKVKAQRRKYREKDLPKYRAISRMWAKNNPELKNHEVSLRRLTIKNRTPSWSDIEKIKQIYLLCPKGMHVDHIIPITSHLVCGLHVEGNLQYLSAHDNISKKNKFNPDEFSIIFEK